MTRLNIATYLLMVAFGLVLLWGVTRGLKLSDFFLYLAIGFTFLGIVFVTTDRR